MISNVKYPDGRTYFCDDCKKAVDRFTSYDKARAAGWAISYDRKNCYCPSCAPFRRNVGHTGERRKIVQQYIQVNKGRFGSGGKN